MKTHVTVQAAPADSRNLYLRVSQNPVLFQLSQKGGQKSDLYYTKCSDGSFHDWGDFLAETGRPLNHFCKSHHT